MPVVDDGGGHRLGFFLTFRHHRAVGACSRLRHGKPVIGRDTAVFIENGGFVQTAILSARKVPGVFRTQEAVGPQARSVKHRQRRSVGQILGRNVDPRQVVPIDGHIRGPRGGGLALVVDPLEREPLVAGLGGHRGFGRVGVIGRVNGVGIDGVGEHEDEGEGKAEERAEQVGVLREGFPHGLWSNPPLKNMSTRP